MLPYFAFGSNMDAAQMEERCPGARSLGLAILPGHRLVFRGPSSNRGGGVGSVDPWEGGEVIGLLWEITTQDVATLDRREGAPHWYQRVPARVVQVGGASVEALLYRLPGRVTEMPPTDDYFRQILAAYATLDLALDPLEDAKRRAIDGEAQPSGPM
jgi:hypothetical protein